MLKSFKIYHVLHIIMFICYNKIITTYRKNSFMNMVTFIFKTYSFTYKIKIFNYYSTDGSRLLLTWKMELRYSAYNCGSKAYSYLVPT